MSTNTSVTHSAYASDDDEQSVTSVTSREYRHDEPGKTIGQSVGIKFPNQVQEPTRLQFLQIVKDIIDTVVGPRDGLTFGLEMFDKEGKRAHTHIHINWIGFAKQQKCNDALTRVLKKTFPEGTWLDIRSKTFHKAYDVDDITRFLRYPLKEKHPYTESALHLMQFPSRDGTMMDLEDIKSEMECAFAERQGVVSVKAAAAEKRKNKSSTSDKIMAHLQKNGIRPQSMYDLHDEVFDYMVENRLDVTPANVAKQVLLIGVILDLADKGAHKRACIDIWGKFAKK